MLGLDFFKQYHCHIDLASEQKSINGDRCNMKSKGASGCAGSTPASYDFKIEHGPCRLHGYNDFFKNEEMQAECFLIRVC
ncbi:hypothetical protein DPMN_091341 [Dreissena polymorpha]|uniref:Uncharacterized protein n=1 Tax=Dreissena polymorpha TaxID=45954 RepID=A0A9D4QZ17_DREPO|nr:hypothetical protein DPMN_091341 [Dreissena polymorpha]